VGVELARRGAGEVVGVDVVDVRETRALPFALYDGLTLPFPDGRFDLAILTFVLHHVPNDRKPALLREALRVARRRVVILEDTPTTAFDRFVSNRHGEAYRRKIGSDAPFGGRCCSRSRARRSCCARTRRAPLEFHRAAVTNWRPRAPGPGDERPTRAEGDWRGAC